MFDGASWKGPSAVDRSRSGESPCRYILSRCFLFSQLLKSSEHLPSFEAFTFDREQIKWYTPLPSAFQTNYVPYWGMKPTLISGKLYLLRIYPHFPPVFKNASSCKLCHVSGSRYQKTVTNTNDEKNQSDPKQKHAWNGAKRRQTKASLL